MTISGTWKAVASDAVLREDPFLLPPDFMPTPLLLLRLPPMPLALLPPFTAAGALPLALLPPLPVRAPHLGTPARVPALERCEDCGLAVRLRMPAHPPPITVPGRVPGLASWVFWLARSSQILYGELVRVLINSSRPENTKRTQGNAGRRKATQSNARKASNTKATSTTPPANRKPKTAHPEHKSKPPTTKKKN